MFYRLLWWPALFSYCMLTWQSVDGYSREKVYVDHFCVVARAWGETHTFPFLFVRFFFFLVLISKDNLRGARFVLIFTRIIVRKMLHKLHGHHSTNITDLFT